MRFASDLTLKLLEYSDGSPLRRDDSALWHHTSALEWIWGTDRVVVPAFHPEGLTDAELKLIEQRRARAPGVTDLGSTPRPFRWFASPAGPAVKAFALHDGGYVTEGFDGRYSRKDVDDMLYFAMKACKVDEAQAWAIYQAVRAGGSAGWGS